MSFESGINQVIQLINEGLIDEAIKILSKLELEQPNDYNVNYLLAITYRKEGVFLLAEAYFLKAIEINKNHLDAYLGLGITYQIQSRYEEAINFIKKSIDIDKHNADSYNSLGYTYKLLGDTEKALEEYNKCIKVLFNNLYHHINRLKDFVPEEKVISKMGRESEKWFMFSIETITKNAGKDGFMKLQFPTAETAEKINKKNDYGSELFIDEGGVRSVLPNMINNFAYKLSENIFYANLLSNIGAAYAQIENWGMARSYFIEAVLFTPENIEFTAPINFLKQMEE